MSPSVLGASRKVVELCLKSARPKRREHDIKAVWPGRVGQNGLFDEFSGAYTNFDQPFGCCRSSAAQAFLAQGFVDVQASLAGGNEPLEIILTVSSSDMFIIAIMDSLLSSLHTPL